MGAIWPARWHLTHDRYRIGATSLANVGSCELVAWPAAFAGRVSTAEHSSMGTRDGVILTAVLLEVGGECEPWFRASDPAPNSPGAG